MNWKARSIVSPPLSDAHLESIVASGKPLNHAKAVQLIGMILRERGDVPEGAAKIPKAEPKPAVAPAPEPEEEIDLSDYVSSDTGEPWADILKKLPGDDRLAMAVENGSVHPVKKD